jgi:hypothetical protein
MARTYNKKRSTHISLRVLYHQQNGTIDADHFTIQRVETESILRRAKHQRPRVTCQTHTKHVKFQLKIFTLELLQAVTLHTSWTRTFNAGWQMFGQLFAIFVSQHFGGANQVWQVRVQIECAQTFRAVQRPAHFFVQRNDLWRGINSKKEKRNFDQHTSQTREEFIIRNWKNKAIST